MSMADWSTRLQAADQAVRGRVRSALARFEREAEEATGEAVQAVEDYWWTLREWRSQLVKWAALLKQPGVTRADVDRYEARVKQWDSLALPFYGDAREEGTAGVGWMPVVIIGTLAVGVTGTAWALAHVADAVAAYQASQVEQAELAARLEAMRNGRVLQETTLRPNPQAQAPGDKPPLIPDGMKDGLMVVGGLTAVGLGIAGFLWWTFRDV
ncbi:hypothetical protein L6R53_15795 [Myxococcota bacterium]|nr:hypothetical protein [Myxococcota bacterium]